jgi:hypothetical protein
MIPSLLNLGASLLRGIPGLPALLLRFMPAAKAVPPLDREFEAVDFPQANRLTIHTLRLSLNTKPEQSLNAPKRR